MRLEPLRRYWSVGIRTRVSRTSAPEDLQPIADPVWGSRQHISASPHIRGHSNGGVGRRSLDLETQICHAGWPLTELVPKDFFALVMLPEVLSGGVAKFLSAPWPCGIHIHFNSCAIDHGPDQYIRGCFGGARKRLVQRATAMSSSALLPANSRTASFS